MDYLTENGTLFTTTSKCVLTITPEGRYVVNLPYGNSVTYLDRKTFEKALLLGTEPFYTRVPTYFNFFGRGVNESF